MSLLTTLNPVFGFNPDGSFKAALSPNVLQFPGVPPLKGGFGARIGIGAGGVDVNASAGIGLPFAGLSGGLGQTLNTTSATGISGPLADGLSPNGTALLSSLSPAMTQDTPGSLFQPDAWGIFDTQMNKVAAWDSVIKVDYRHEMKIADFPIERGAFASYNKVQVPFDVRISFAIGGKGGAPAREQFLAHLEAAVQSLNMYVVVTPEAIYPQANLFHMEYSRESRRGLNLLVVEVWVQEVRVSEGSAFTDDKTGQSPTYMPAVVTNAQPVDLTKPTITDVPDMPVRDGEAPTRFAANMPTGSASGSPADSFDPALPGASPDVASFASAIA